jgi:diguanylate cyclase (GGDEF)-like protein
MKPFFPPPSGSIESRLARFERRAERERMARLEAEAIAEKGLRELYESRQQLALLQRITEASSEAGSVAGTFQYAIEQICNQLSWGFGIAHFIDEAGDWSDQNPLWFALEQEAVDHLIQLATARIRHVIEAGSVNISNGADHDATEAVCGADCDARRVQPGHRAYGSIVAIPVRLGGELVAIVQFISPKTIVHNDGLVGLMMQIGIQLARTVGRKRNEALLHDARHDSLTGLPNRVKLAEESSAAFGRLPPGRDGLAMLVVDLDGFKAINDRLGHHAGDTLLVEVARRLRAATDEWLRHMADMGHTCRSLVSRTGGDEFAIMLEGFSDTSASLLISTKLHGCLGRPIGVGGGEVAYVSASIGIAFSTAEHKDVDDLQRDADLAMYEAKSVGQGRTIVFTHALGLSARNRLKREQDVREAVLEHRFLPYYQPILSLGNPREVRGYEALARWHHPEKGIIEPAEFIEIAEKTGLITHIDDAMLREACRALTQLQQSYGAAAAPFISVNVAPQQFLQPNFLAHLRTVIAESGVDPVGLRLEVTETVAILDHQRTGRILQAIKDMGIHTSLDDFGTGFSSLSYLHTLPFDSLKIDRSFIFALDNPRCLKIVQTILDLAQRLEMEVVAEGIEDQAHCDQLQQLGCQLGQGYLFARPLPEDLAFLPPTHIRDRRLPISHAQER